MGHNDRMTPEQAQALAEKYRERYPEASPREIAAIVNDPTQHFNESILGNVYRGIKVPSNMTSAQSDAWRRAVDQRAGGFEGRESAREAEARRRLNEEIRSNIAGVVKPASLAVSVTPYDLGFGDVGYAAGELIDPEGTYGDAALAAAGGILTGGIGSGALMTKAAKEARALQRAADRADAARKLGVRTKDLDLPMKPKWQSTQRVPKSSSVRHSPGQEMKRADDVEGLIPTKIGVPGPSVPVLRKATEFQDYANRYSTGGRYPTFSSPVKNLRPFTKPSSSETNLIGGLLAGGYGMKAYMDRGQQEAEPVWDRDRTFQAYEPSAEADIEGFAARNAARRQSMSGAGVPDEVSMSDWHATGRASDMPPEYYDSDAPYKPGTGGHLRPFPERKDPARSAKFSEYRSDPAWESGFQAVLKNRDQYTMDDLSGSGVSAVGVREDALMRRGDSSALVDMGRAEALEFLERELSKVADRNLAGGMR